MPTGLENLLPHVPAFLMVLARMTGIFIFAPVFGSSVIPMRVKALLAIVLAFSVYPIVPAQLPIELNVFTLGLAMGTELLIGLVIGYGASLPLIAMQLGGVMIGHQLGLGLAQVMDPQFNEQTEVLSQFLFMVALALFLMLDGHHAMFAALIESYRSVPLGGYRPDGTALTMIVGLLRATFELGMRVAAPVLCLIFLETVAMGFVARTVPQLNILSLGFPLRIMAGLSMLIGMVTVMFTTLGDAMGEMLGRVMQLFAVGGV